MPGGGASWCFLRDCFIFRHALECSAGRVSGIVSVAQVSQSETSVTAPVKASLASYASQYTTSISQIMLDNNLNGLTAISGGDTLVIKSSTGTWSSVYGLTKNGKNDMSLVPVVLACSSGQYAVSFTVSPSQWFDPSQPGDVGGNWAGKIAMTCSDGSALTFDASPAFAVDAPSGTTTQANGFPEVFLTSSTGRVDSLLGVGAVKSGKTIKFSCPKGGLISGFSAGADPSAYPSSWVVNLQFLCMGEWPYFMAWIPDVIITVWNQHV